MDRNTAQYLGYSPAELTHEEAEMMAATVVTGSFDGIPTSLLRRGLSKAKWTMAHLEFKESLPEFLLKELNEHVDMLRDELKRREG